MALDLFTLFMEATHAKVIERVEVPARPERRRAPPHEFAEGRINQWLQCMAGGASELRLHQSLALEQIAAGENVVISTGTASGKSLVFQTAVVRELLEGTGRSLLLYPQKALGNDQERRMIEAVELAGLNRALVGMIHGDIAMHARDEALARARVILATPDIIQSWLMRQSMSPLVRAFLTDLKLLIIDEAHVLEGVFGSNAAYLIRRLFAAQARILKEGASR